jgi:hypothetical protein
MAGRCPGIRRSEKKDPSFANIQKPRNDVATIRPGPKIRGPSKTSFTTGRIMAGVNFKKQAPLAGNGIHDRGKHHNDKTTNY